MTIGELAATTGSQPEALRRLVRALASMGVFRQLPNDAVESTALGATLSARGLESVRDAALFWMETHYLPFNELLHTIRTGEPAADRYYGRPFFDWIIKDSERIALLTGAMANVTNGLRAGTFDDYRLLEGEAVADLGGADGTVLLTLLAEEPDHRGIVFDLPEVVSRARESLARHAAADRGTDRLSTWICRRPLSPSSRRICRAASSSRDRTSETDAVSRGAEVTVSADPLRRGTSREHHVPRSQRQPRLQPHTAHPVARALHRRHLLGDQYPAGGQERLLQAHEQSVGVHRVLVR